MPWGMAAPPTPSGVPPLLTTVVDMIETKHRNLYYFEQLLMNKGRVPSIGRFIAWAGIGKRAESEYSLCPCRNGAEGAAQRHIWHAVYRNHHDTIGQAVLSIIWFKFARQSVLYVRCKDRALCRHLLNGEQGFLCSRKLKFSFQSLIIVEIK